MIGLQSFIPRDFQSLLKHMGPSALKVVDWGDALKALKTLSTRYLSQDTPDALKASLREHLPAEVQFVDKFPSNKAKFENEVTYAEEVLKTYFSQLKCPEGLFLDLRQSRFEQTDEILMWKPNSLWVSFTGEFREGLLEIYKGYYGKDDDLMDSGLNKMGLLSAASTPDQKAEIKNLILNHIGSDSPNAVEFKLEKFTESFEALFSYLKKHNMKISVNFIYLGIYLVSLYLNLSQIQRPIDVKAVANSTL